MTRVPGERPAYLHKPNTRHLLQQRGADLDKSGSGLRNAGELLGNLRWRPDAKLFVFMATSALDQLELADAGARDRQSDARDVSAQVAGQVDVHRRDVLGRERVADFFRKAAGLGEARLGQRRDGVDSNPEPWSSIEAVRVKP